MIISFHNLKVLCFGSATIVLSSAYCFQLEEYIVVCVEERERERERERVLQVHIMCGFLQGVSQTLCDIFIVAP
jgi:hypothetical protein